MRFFWIACLALSGVEGLAGCATSPADDRYDLVIRGAKVVDGTGRKAFTADVAIRGDRVEAVGPVPGDARRVIDGRGLVVAPGFIDNHAHSDDLLFEDGLAQSKIRQGVTTEILGEHTSGGPYLGKLPPHRPGVRTLGDYLAAVERSGISLNVASYVSQGNLWRCVMGESFDRPSPAQLEEMKALLAQAMEEGAWGMSIMVAEPPGLLATSDDLVELAKVSARYKGVYSTHIRNEGTGVLDAVKEAIAVGERSGARVDIIHIKIADQAFWGRMKEVVALIDEARKRGVDVQSNIYPYTRGNNNLAAILPPWAREGGKEKILDRLRDPAERAKIKRDVEAGLPGWYNHYTAVGRDWARMLVNEDLSTPNKRFEGWTMDKILEARGATDKLDGWLDFLLEEKASISCIYEHHTDADRDLALSQPWCSIGSDGSAYAIEGPLRRGKPHPRNFGTFPRVLGVFVREKKLLTLEDAVRKMTSLTAAKVGLRDRGVIRAGAKADLVLFDPATVIDKSTYLEPFQYPVGIDTVIVNGRVVLDKGKHTGEKPGKALRRGKD
ncbi:MAG TPA: D-aminoacylase [Planctomycetota bacterium]